MAMNKKVALLLLGVIGIHFYLLYVIKFTAWPEMLLWPYLIIKGWLPYNDITIAHAPLMLVKLSIFFKIFGVGILQLKIFTWLLILVLDLLVFWISKKLWGTKNALTAISIFILSQVFFEGNGLWFDLFMGLLAFVSYYFVKRKRFIWTGVFWALALMSKQTAFWFLVPIGLEVLSTKNRVPNIRTFIFGATSVIIPSILILWFLGILPDFYSWAIRFGIFVLPRAQGQLQLPDIKNFAISIFPFTIFVPLFIIKKKESLSLALWSLAGMMGAYPRFEYFHFQPAIPYLAIAIALVFANDWHKRELVKAFIPVYVLGGMYLFGGFFLRNFTEGTRFYETDVYNIVKYVKANTKPGDKIFVLNYWDSVYALTGTFPAIDPWVPQLSWYMETSGIQDKMVEELTKSKPKLILENPYESTGLASYKPALIYDYVAKNYEFKEKIDGIEVLVPKK